MRFIPGQGYDYVNDENDAARASGGIFSNMAISPGGGGGSRFSPLPSGNTVASPVTPAPTGPRTIADNWMNQPTAADAILGINRNPAPTPTPGMPDLSGIGNLGNALNTAGTVNQFNLDYYRGAEQSDPIFSAAQRLLNPNDSQANYDVNMHGAELATARGVPGSGLASETTGRIRQADIERRAALANQLLSGAHGRVPQPFDVGSQLLTAVQAGQLSLAQAQLALQREVQLGHLDLQRAQYYLGLLRGGGGGSGGGGGGGRNAPLPGAGGGAPSEPNPRSGPAFQTNPFWNPLPTPPGMEPDTSGGTWWDQEGIPRGVNQRPDYGYEIGVGGTGPWSSEAPYGTWINPANNTSNSPDTIAEDWPDWYDIP